MASAVKRGVARTTDAPDATALDAAAAFSGAKPSLPTSVVVDGRLVDVKAVVSRTEVSKREHKHAHWGLLLGEWGVCSAFCCKGSVGVCIMRYVRCFVFVYAALT